MRGRHTLVCVIVAVLSFAAGAMLGSGAVSVAGQVETRTATLVREAPDGVVGDRGRAYLFRLSEPLQTWDYVVVIECRGDSSIWGAGPDGYPLETIPLRFFSGEASREGRIAATLLWEEDDDGDGADAIVTRTRPTYDLTTEDLGDIHQQSTGSVEERFVVYSVERMDVAQ